MKNHFVLPVLVGVLGCLTLLHCPQSPDSKEITPSAAVQKISASSGLAMPKLRTAYVEAEARRRQCVAAGKSPDRCLQIQSRELQALGLSETDQNELRGHSIALRWELTEFLQRHKLSEADLRSLFSKLMPIAEACSGKTPPVGCSSGQAFHGECRNFNLEPGACSAVFSMGVDYRWPASSDTFVRRKITDPR